MGQKATNILLGVLFLLFGLTGLAFAVANHEKVFYLHAYDDPRDAWRLLWMAPFAYVGLGVRAFALVNKPATPWRQYVVYFLYVAVASGTLFLVIHTALPVDNWLFYLAAPIASFLFALIPGKAVAFLKGLFAESD